MVLFQGTLGDNLLYGLKHAPFRLPELHGLRAPAGYTRERRILATTGQGDDHRVSSKGEGLPGMGKLEYVPYDDAVEVKQRDEVRNVLEHLGAQ